MIKLIKLKLKMVGLGICSWRARYHTKILKAKSNEKLVIRAGTESSGVTVLRMFKTCLKEINR